MGLVASIQLVILEINPKNGTKMHYGFSAAAVISDLKRCSTFLQENT